MQTRLDGETDVLLSSSSGCRGTLTPPCVAGRWSLVASVAQLPLSSRLMFAAERRPQAVASSPFVCQKCAEPLRIHTSLAGLEPAALADLVDRCDRSAVLAQPVRASDASKMSDSESNGNGFLIIGEAAADVRHPPPPLDHRDMSYRLQVTSRLFDILSDQSEVKHPLCEECADFVIDQMDAKLRQTEEECKVYREYEEALRLSTENQEQQSRDRADLSAQLDRLQQEERQLLLSLEAVDREEELVRRELEQQASQLEQVDVEEGKYWQEYNGLKRAFFASEDELQSVTNQLRYTQGQLERLKRSNVFNITFHIWHCGHFGTINGFRLGRLPTVPVEWSEINAAWGQAALLLHCMAKKISLTFQRFRLVPYGNFSFLESLDDRSKQLPL